MSTKELPTDRLASTDEKGKRVFIHPADVKGHFKNMRNIIHGFLIVLFLVLPWVKINGYQSILLDIAHRKFVIFGLAFWAHDAPMLIFVFGSVFLGISLFTIVWGRIWCGWTCPETVFVESVYRRIERWVEGNAVQRKRLAKAPWTAKKFGIKGFKWLLFLLFTLLLTHSFLAYFVGTERLGEMMTHSPSENPKTFVVMAFSTAVLLFAFGWFREQFCIILCPYGRFQSVLMDENSLVVAYDEKRGEPRRTKEAPKEGLGDCINCYRCVDVCPTGIDIRRGVQMECITCTACIDACNEVMLRVKKPPELIKYTTFAQLNGDKVKHFRPRVIILSLALTGVLVALSVLLFIRPPLKATIFNAKNVPYQVVEQKADPLIANQFIVNASNYTLEDGTFEIVSNDPQFEIVSPTPQTPVKAGEEIKLSFFVRFPKSALTQGKLLLPLTIKTKAANDRWQREYVQEVPIAGPL